MRMPGAASLLRQETDKGPDVLARHFAKPDNIRIHARKPRGRAIVIRDVISALAEGDIPAQHSQPGVCACCLNGTKKK